MDTKWCYKCNLDLPIESFNKHKRNKDGLAFECRNCKGIIQRAYYKSSKLRYTQQIRDRKRLLARLLQEYKKNLSCSCGENHPACLQFHHITNDKEINVSAASNRGWSWERTLSEIKKCIVLCANCHFKLHYDKDIN